MDPNVLVTAAGARGPGEGDRAKEDVAWTATRDGRFRDVTSSGVEHALDDGVAAAYFAAVANSDVVDTHGTRHSAPTIKGRLRTQPGRYVDASLAEDGRPRPRISGDAPDVDVKQAFRVGTPPVAPEGSASQLLHNGVRQRYPPPPPGMSDPPSGMSSGAESVASSYISAAPSAATGTDDDSDGGVMADVAAAAAAMRQRTLPGDPGTASDGSSVRSAAPPRRRPPGTVHELVGDEGGVTLLEAVIPGAHTAPIRAMRRRVRTYRSRARESSDSGGSGGSRRRPRRTAAQRAMYASRAAEDQEHINGELRAQYLAHLREYAAKGHCVEPKPDAPSATLRYMFEETSYRLEKEKSIKRMRAVVVLSCFAVEFVMRVLRGGVLVDGLTRFMQARLKTGVLDEVLVSLHDKYIRSYRWGRSMDHTLTVLMLLLGFVQVRYEASRNGARPAPKDIGGIGDGLAMLGADGLTDVMSALGGGDNTPRPSPAQFAQARADVGLGARQVPRAADDFSAGETSSDG